MQSVESAECRKYEVEKMRSKQTREATAMQATREVSNRDQT